MITSPQMIENVLDKIDDASIDQDMVLAVLNQGCGEIASIVLLPDLASSGTVVTEADKAFVALPTTYHRELTRVTSAALGAPVILDKSFAKFQRRYGVFTMAGAVERVVIRGNSLFYQGIPASPDTLTLWFHRKPTPMTLAVDSVPDGLPEDLAQSLLENYAFWKLYPKVEDDEDGGGANTKKHQFLFSDALAALQLFVGDPDGDPEYVERDDEDY